MEVATLRTGAVPRRSAAAGMVGGIILASILGGIAIAVTGDDDGPALLVAGFIGLWLPLVGAALIASTVFGSGSVKRDLGLVVRDR